MSSAIVKNVKERTAFELAHQAECGSPNTNSSPGAQLLVSVRDSLIETWEEGRFAEECHDTVLTDVLDIDEAALRAIEVDSGSS